MQPINIPARGTTLKGTLYQPPAAPKAAIVLHGATGVPACYYRHFAEWLTTQGYACLTYDYRDFGASATGHPKHSTATMVDWGVHDQSAAQAALTAHLPDAPLWVIGHSLGGFMLPFQPNAAQISRVITVASGAAYIGDHPWPYRAMALLFWYGPGPLGTKLLGYLPGKALGLGPNLPAQVYWQWRRWCTSKSFYEAETALPPLAQPFTGPLKIIAMVDDVMMPPQSVWKLARYYPKAQQSRALLHPKVYGLKHIGHIEIFNPRSANIWPDIIS
ncbi:MAG: alpha/beta fold hydrolase [Rhodobacteraceae bacterium]|nr:alpha/beta fold hydrolase [Paracoccaceae bacterium]